jgi:hypothetical protein
LINFHYVLFGFFKSFLKDVTTDFTLTNPDLYKSEFTRLRDSNIFYNSSLLRALIPGIHRVIRDHSSGKTQLSTYYPKIRPTTVKLRGGHKSKSDKLTRKRRHQDKIHNFSHTIKVAQKSSINTKKTRRNPHMHHQQVLLHESHVKT